jgi:hypothetical protein
VVRFTMWKTLSPGNTDASDHCIGRWLGAPPPYLLNIVKVKLSLCLTKHHVMKTHPVLN